MKYLLIVLSLVFIGCGSLKKDKTKHTVNEEIRTSLNEEKKTQELEYERKQLYELIYNTNLRADSIVQAKDGTTKIYNPSIKTEAKETKQEDIKEKDKKEDLKTDLDIKEKKEKTETSTHVDRKQYSWLVVVFLVVILMIYIYFFKGNLFQWLLKLKKYF
ncbi:MAG: hypothetical protein LBE34_12620 [Flavobacteriaceae bacterium]|jgi:preprotein translocase subunit SecF|nr:hypothetical protein [Flavobacteriaceae bacterium]